MESKLQALPEVYLDSKTYVPIIFFFPLVCKSLINFDPYNFWLNSQYYFKIFLDRDGNSQPASSHGGSNSSWGSAGWLNSLCTTNGRTTTQKRVGEMGLQWGLSLRLTCPETEEIHKPGCPRMGTGLLALALGSETPFFGSLSTVLVLVGVGSRHLDGLPGVPQKSLWHGSGPALVNINIRSRHPARHAVGPLAQDSRTSRASRAPEVLLPFKIRKGTPTTS